MKNPRSTYTDGLNFYGKTNPVELLEGFGSPLYVYNENILRARCRDLTGLCKHSGFRVNYSAKANANPALLKIIREEGCLVDAMSPGELEINLMSGFAPERILYVCNNVSAEELRAPIAKNIPVSVDSLSQLDLYGQVNPGGRVVVRFNPGIGAGHHKKVVTAGKETKFGVDPEKTGEAHKILQKHDLTLAGINHHIGSLFMEGDGYVEAAAVLLGIYKQMPESMRRNIEIIDFGGGFGIPYHKYDGEKRLDMADLGKRLDALMDAFCRETGYQGHFYVEPGRYPVAECGVVLGTVHAVKNNGPNRYVGTDIGFNVLARPMLYDAFHDIEIYRPGGPQDGPDMPQTIVGNICESGDILAKSRMLPEVREGDILGMLDAGAYGHTMSSNYNQRLRPAEVLITANGEPRLIRRRDTIDDLLRPYAGLNTD